MTVVNRPDKPDAKAKSNEMPPPSFPPTTFPAKEAIRQTIHVAREQSSHPHHGRLDGIVRTGGIVAGRRSGEHRKQLDRHAG
jgi:hypothetical protein